MIVLFLAAVSATAAPPVVPYASVPSAAYRDCVSAQHARSPAPVARIGRGACAGKRSKLLSRVKSHLGYGWAATAKTTGQSKRMKAQLKLNAEQAVARYEADLQAWLAARNFTSSSVIPAKAGAVDGRRPSQAAAEQAESPSGLPLSRE